MLRSRNNSKNMLRETPNKGCLTNEPTPAKTILFVDDEASILKVRKLVFENMGYCVLTAESGKEALKILRENAVDVVVLDCLMPEMDGEETARRIRRLPGDIPIVLSSGCLSLPQRVLELVNASVDKTAGPEALRDAVEQQFHPAPVEWESSRLDAAMHLESS
jgi:CheY-like chemotaxis protein